MAIRTLIALSAAALIAGCSASGGTAPEKRQAVQDMEADSLAAFYEKKPDLRAEVQDAAGYAVFSNVGVQVILVSGGGGYGVVHNNRTGEDTYMRMGEAGVGLGVGVKDFRALFVFRNEDSLNDFIYSGWQFGGEADAAAKSDNKGGAASGAGNFNDNVSTYQLTDTGLIAGVAFTGTKFWKDKDLN